MQRCLEIALLHEVAHAWMVVDTIGVSVTIIIPIPGSGDDARCGWSCPPDTPAAAMVSVALAGLAAELAAGIEPHLAWENAADDIAVLAEAGLAERLTELIPLVSSLLDDARAARFYQGIRM